MDAHRRQLVAAAVIIVILCCSVAGAQPRGYQSRPCGFDLDDDGIVGEPSDDCTVCDGSTTDPDGDGTDEDLIYIDCDAGINSMVCGSTITPCLTLAYALANRGDGAGDGAEDIYCLKGTCDSVDLTLSSGDSGVAGTKTRTASGSEAYDFEYPSNPAMIVGWDADGDGSYPPHDTDDTAEIDPEAMAGHWLEFNGASRFEVAHLSFLPNLTPAGASDYILSFANASSNPYSHIYAHDLSLDRWLQNAGQASNRILVATWVNGAEATWLAVENLTCSLCGGGYFQRGSALDTDQDPSYAGAGPLRFKSVTVTVDGADGSYWHGSKPWGEWDGFEFLDSVLDFRLSNWSPTDNPATSCFTIGQCTQQATIRNNYCIGGGRLVVLQASAAGSCESRQLCNDSNGDGDLCWIDRNEMVHDYDYADDQTLRTTDGSGSALLGDVLFSNNVTRIATAIDDCVEDTGLARSGASLRLVGNTWSGTVGDDACIHASGNFDTVSLIDNVIDVTGAVAVRKASGVTTWSADGNTYPEGSNLWVWDGSTETTLGDWQTASSADAGAVQCAPTFASATDLHLSAADACALDAGVNASAHITVDFDGDPRPQGAGWDIGADELVAAQPAPRLEGVSLAGGVSIN